MDDTERGDLERQVGKQLLDTIKDPSARLLGKANGAVGGVNLIVILVMLAYQIIVVPTKTELSEVKADIQEVREQSATKDDLEKVVLASQKDIEGVSNDVRDLKIDLRDAARLEIPPSLLERLRLLEQDVRTLRAPTGAGSEGDKK